MLLSSEHDLYQAVQGRNRSQLQLRASCLSPGQALFGYSQIPRMPDPGVPELRALPLHQPITVHISQTPVRRRHGGNLHPPIS